MQISARKRGPESRFMQRVAPHLIEFIRSYQDDAGSAPSLASIAAEFNVTRQMAHKYVAQLEANGVVRREFTNQRRVKWIHIAGDETRADAA